MKYTVPKDQARRGDAHLSKLDGSNGESSMKPNLVQKEFSQKMIDARNSLKWTRKDLAIKAGLTESVIALYENGTAVKNQNEMNKIQSCIQRALNPLKKS